MDSVGYMSQLGQQYFLNVIDTSALFCVRAHILMAWFLCMTAHSHGLGFFNLGNVTVDVLVPPSFCFQCQTFHAGLETSPPAQLLVVKLLTIVVAKTGPLKAEG